MSWGTLLLIALLVLVCPLSMYWMRRRHGHGGHRSDKPAAPDKESDEHRH